MSDTAAKRAVLQGEFDELVRTYGENADDWPIGQAKFGERIMRGIEKLDAQDQLTASRTARADVIRTAMSDPANRENGFGGGVSVGSMGHHSDPWANLGDNVIRADSLTGLMIQHEKPPGYSAPNSKPKQPRRPRPAFPPFSPLLSRS